MGLVEECRMTIASHKLGKEEREIKICIFFYFLLLNLCSGQLEIDLTAISCTNMRNKAT